MRQSHLKKRNLRGFFAGATSAYVRRKDCCNLLLSRRIRGLGLVRVRKDCEEVANERRVAILEATDTVGGSLIITLAVDAILIENEDQWVEREDGVW